MKIIKYIFLILLLISYFSCSETGILYSLENEEEIQESNNLNNSANFSNMIMTTGYYIGASGPNIYYRSTSSSETDTTTDDWSALPLPTGDDDTVDGTFSSDTTVNSMVQVGNDLVASLISYDGASVVSGIYRLANVNTLDLTTVQTNTWTMIVKTTMTKGSNPVNVYKLFGANNNLYVNHLTYTYSSTTDNTGAISSSALYFEDDITTINNDLVTNSIAINISSYAKDDDGNDMVTAIESISSGGSDYWMIINGETNGSVFQSTDGTTFVNITSGLTDSTDPKEARFVDVYEYSDQYVLISNTNGSLYVYNDTSDTFAEKTLASNYINGFVDISTITANTVLVGTTAAIGDSTYDGSGYYHLNTTDWSFDTSANFSDSNNYTSSDLSDSSINGFLYDSINNRLFAYTSNAGVWLNTPNGSSRTWSLE